MKFDYGYRDSTNARLTGTVEAPSRDEAYRLLRETGVKPTFVTLAPGLANRLLAFGKRGWSIVALGALCLVLLGLIVLPFSPLNLHLLSQPTFSDTPLARRQIYGDPALMEKLQLENYVSLFAAEGDRVLAHFAQPALQDRFVLSLRRDPSVRAQAVRALAALGSVDAISSSCSVDAKSVRVSASRETAELARIVLWMRGEFATYLSSGPGTPASYLDRLLERQQFEADIYARAKRDLAKETDPETYEKRNDALRAIGAPTIPLPSP